MPLTIREHLATVANLLRLHTAGFEGFVFIAGPMVNGSNVRFENYAILWLIGVLVNGYIFALNDLVDLPRDRLNPAKARSPLVSGAMSTDVALLWSIGLPLLAVIVTALQGWPDPAQVSFVLLLLLGAWVNVYQKRTEHPLVMDMLFAVTMAAPLPVTARATSESVGAPVWWSTALLFLLALQLNSVAGNLKDLRSDRRTGFRTVAIAFGADTSVDGRLVAGRKYGLYCWALYAAIIGTGVIALWVEVRSSSLTAGVLCGAVLVTAAATSAVSLHRLLSGKRPPSRRGRELYFAAGFLVLLTAIGMRAAWWVLVPSLALLGLWELGFSVYWTWYWRTTAPAGNVGGA